MSLNDFKHIGTIETITAKTAVTINSNAGSIWKCKVTDLQYKTLPSPDGGARFHGLALVSDESGNIGAFLMCNANPTNASSGGVAAEEIWLDSLPISFLNAEFGSSQATKLTEIAVPAAGQSITFMSISGANPQNAWNITGASFAGGCAESTLQDHRLDLHEDVLKLKKLLDAVNAPGLSNLLSIDHSIFSRSLLSWVSGLAVNVSSGSAMFKGINFNHAGGSITGLAEKTLYRGIVTQAGVYQAQEENSTEGTLDAEYNPSGSSPLPSTAPAPWTLTGTFSTQTVGNSILTLAVSANSAFYSRLNVVNAPTNGAFQDYLVQWVSGTGFAIDIDTGSGNNLARLFIENGYIELGSTGKRINCNTAQGVVVRLVNKNGSSRVYVNGQLVASSSSLLASSGTNRFRFGWFSSSTGSVRIGKITTKNLGLNEQGAPSFLALAGAVLGTLVTFTAAHSIPVALQGASTDTAIGARKEGALVTQSDLIILRNKAPNVRQISANDIVLTTDNYIICNGSNITLTAQTLVGNENFECTIENIHSSGFVNFTPPALIDGKSSILIPPTGKLTFYSDGATFRIKSLVSNWFNHGAINITGTTTNPTKGTIVIDQVWSRREGNILHFKYLFRQSTGGSAGAGFYLLGMPGSYLLDTNTHPLDTSAIGLIGTVSANLISSVLESFGLISSGSGSADSLSALAYTNNTLRLTANVNYTNANFANGIGPAGAGGAGFFVLSAANYGFILHCKAQLAN